MKHLFFKGATAGAAALLLAAGLGVPVGAAPATCTVSVTTSTTPVAEGNAGGTNTLVFTVTGVASNQNQCDEQVVDYTLGGTATSGTDYTAPATQQVTLGLAGEPAQITLPIIGDTAVEPDETVTVTLTPGTTYTVGTAGSATGTIQNDDALPAEPDPIADGGTASIDPTSGTPGTKITVTGTSCTGTEGSASLVKKALDPATQDDEPVATGTAVPGADDTFTVELTVPQGTDPAREYYVRAGCKDGATFEAYSQSPAFDVVPFATGATVSPGDNGYRMVAADGGIFTFGDRTFHGSTGDLVLNKPIVGGATDISDYDGYWIVASDGGVFTFNAEFHGSLAGQTLAAPAVEIEPTPTGKGYFIVLANGKVYTFGDANFFGDISATRLNQPIIGMSVTPTGKGYWLVGQDGGIFNYGDADFFGSMGDKALNAPIIDLAPAVDNQGYYLLGADGGVFTFGSADFKGSTGDIKLNAPVVAMLVNPTGAGYWLAATDGGIFTFGAVEFLGSTGGIKLNSPVLDLIN